MIPAEWRYAAASALGTSHARLGLPCQDASACRVLTGAKGEAVLVAAASDGAGSALRAEVGARLACDLVVDEVATLLETGGDLRRITREFLESWLLRFQNEVAARAEAEELAPRDFACTLLAAVVGADCAVFFQIGDGTIVVSTADEGDSYNWIFWPANGEYANTTFFATDPEAASHLSWDLMERRVEELALLTDGLQQLALHFQTRTAHAPFFRPLLAAVRNAGPIEAAALSEKLAGYLDSPAVNERTDDDKTLILATRRHEKAEGLR